MKNLLACVAALGLGFAVTTAGAQNLTVQYVEGSASVRSGSTWSPLSIGDTVPSDASVRVDRFGLVQLNRPGASITLTQPGTYSMREVIAAGASLRSAGAVEAAAVAFSRVLRGTGKMASSAGGVRSEVMPTTGLFDDIATGEYAPEKPSPPAIPMDPVREAIDFARDLLADGRYPQAISELQAVAPSATGDGARELAFYLASAFELNGDPRSALAALREARPSATDAWEPDAVLLGARLLVDTFAWSEARDLLERASATLAFDQERAPSYYFLLALAYRGTGEKARERKMLDAVISLDPESDLAIAAARLGETL